MVVSNPTHWHKKRLEAEAEEEGKGWAQSAALLYQREQVEGRTGFVLPFQPSQSTSQQN